jgi:hypothetical protein
MVSTKEGGFLWDPNCRAFSVKMLFDPPEPLTPEMHRLNDLLESDGNSDHPVIATLTGVLTYGSSADKKRKIASFTITAATNVHLSKKIERP